MQQFIYFIPSLRNIYTFAEVDIIESTLEVQGSTLQVETIGPFLGIISIKHFIIHTFKLYLTITITRTILITHFI